MPKIKATLYFASEDGLTLVPTEREVPLAEGAIAQARAIGISGVPFFVFDERLGVSGAQSVDVFIDALTRAASGR